MKEENSRRIALRIDEKTYESIRKSAIKNNVTVSDEIRKAMKEYLKVSSREEYLDDTVAIIDEAIETHIKKLGNRLAPLLNKNTIISASGYFTLLALLSEVLNPLMQGSAREIDKKARKFALEFANTKSGTSISDFLEKMSMEDISKSILSKKSDLDGLDNLEDLNGIDLSKIRFEDFL